MFRIKNSIPNFITSLNIACGGLSIILSFEGYPTIAAYLILVAAVLDFLDGMTARLLNAYSELGKQLDSLADMLSFGLAPSILVYHIMKSALSIEGFNPSQMNGLDFVYLFSILLIPIFSGLRLAKFNIDTNQSTSFVGMPTPANAIFFASIPIIASIYPNDAILSAFYDKNLLVVIIIVSSLLLVSPIPMFSLKFKHLKPKGNEIRFIFLSLIIILLILLGINNEISQEVIAQTGQLSIFQEIFYILTKALPLIIFLYILLSIIYNTFVKFKKTE